MENLRKEFEEWARATSLQNFLWFHKSDNRYEVFAVEQAWRGYQAGRSVSRSEATDETPTN